MLTLDALRPGDRGVIESIDADGLVLQRLLEMGLDENEEIEMLAVAPLGDPYEIRVRGYCLSLRRGEARRVRVRRTEP